MMLVPFAAFSRSAGAQATPETTRGPLMLKSGMGVGELPLPVQQAKAAMLGEDALMAILRGDAALANPVGYGVIMHRSEGRTQAAKAFGLPFDYGLTNFIWYYGWEDDDKGGRTIAMNNGRFDFVVLVNGTGFGADINEPLAPDGGPPFIRGYAKTGTFRDRDVYDGQCVFLTRNGQPPLIPATRERYLIVGDCRRARRLDTARGRTACAAGDNVMGDNLKAYLRDRPKREADMRAAYTEIKKTSPEAAEQMLAAFKKGEADGEAQLRAAAPAMDQQIRQARAEGAVDIGLTIKKLQTQLDAMSPAERKRPAFIVELGGGQSRLAGSDDSDTTPLVQVNVAAYDKRLAPEVPQVISVCIPGLQAGYPKEDRNWTPQRARDAQLIRDGLNWTALEAMVKPKP